MQLTRNAGASLLQVILGALIMFGLYRGILEILGAEQLGVWAIVLASATASRLGDLGMSISVTRFVAMHRARDKDKDAADAVQTALISIAIFIVLFALLIYPVLHILMGQVFEGENLVSARKLLPLAMVSMVLSTLATVPQAGLDGCQRYDLRAALVLGGQLFFLVSGLLLAKNLGLLGLAYAQILQALLLLPIGWILLAKTLPTVPSLPLSWRRERFTEMFRYGIQYYFSSMAMLLFEPLTKILIGKYAGVATAGYYEMASQLVAKVRQLVVSANQVLVPFTAELLERDPSRLSDVYQFNLRLVLTVSLPLFALVIAYSPIISELWIGDYEPVFVTLVIVLSGAWCLNTFSLPAYFQNLGTGLIGWNAIAYVWIGSSNLVLGLYLGPKFGLEGIATSVTLALATGSLLIIMSHHLRSRHKFLPLVNGRMFVLLTTSIAVGFIGLLTYQWLENQSFALRLFLCLALPATLIALVLVKSPVLAETFEKVRAQGRA